MAMAEANAPVVGVSASASGPVPVVESAAEQG